MAVKHFRSLIAAFLLLGALAGGLGWTVYAPVHQERLNHALIAAIKEHETKTALAVLAAGADPNTRDDPPQHLSLWRLLLKALRGQRPAPSTAPTALLMVCDRGYDDAVLVRALLDRGAAMEVKDAETGRTPLLLASFWNETEVSALLIAKGANVHAADPDGVTPLLLAICNHNKGLVRLLANRGVDVNSAVARKVLYEAPDKKTCAIVIYYKPIPYGDGESRVDIQDSKGHLLKSRDYSDGGTQGYRVVKAGWTADSRFFVFSTTSAGGHSPWHYPTHFYDLRRNRFYLLDSVSEHFVAITDPRFRLRSPCRITVEYGPTYHPTFDLSKLNREQLEMAVANERSMDRASGRGE